LDSLARKPLPRWGTTRLVWRDGQLTEVLIALRRSLMERVVLRAQAMGAVSRPGC
jgi:hypothetical protein